MPAKRKLRPQTHRALPLPDPPTTRSGLVRQMPGATVTQENAAKGETATGPPQGPSRGPAQYPPEYVQTVLRGHTELMVECRRMAEACKNMEAVEAALYRRELEESRKEVNELHKEVHNLGPLSRGR